MNIYKFQTTDKLLDRFSDLVNIVRSEEKEVLFQLIKYELQIRSKSQYMRKVKKSIHLNSLSVNLETNKYVLMNVISGLLPNEGKVKDNNTDEQITSCMSFLVNNYIAHIPLLEELEEIRNNLENLEIYEI